MSNKPTVITPEEDLQFMEENNYEVNEDVVFNYLSMDVLKDNVAEQINGLGNLEMVTSFPSLIPINVNYIEKFNEKYNAVGNIIDKDDNDIKVLLVTSKTEFYAYVCKLLFKKFNLNFTFNFTYTTNEERFLYIEALYKYFVLDMEDTLINYVVNNMITNSKSIIKSMKSLVNKKDIAFTMYKKELENSDYATLIYNVENYIETLDKESIEDFIEDSLSMKDEPIEGYRELVKELFLNETDNLIEDLSFNFSGIKSVLKYILTDSTSTVLKIKTSLLEYYKKLS